jgi:RecA-family ATPase
MADERNDAGAGAPPWEDETVAKAPEPPPIVRLWRSAGELGAFDRARQPKARAWLLEREPRNDDERSGLMPGGLVGVLPLGKVGLLASAGGVGKTMALCQLAIAVAAGVPWLGNGLERSSGWHVPIASRGRVLLLLGEEDEEEAHRRLYNAASALGLDDAGRAQAAERVCVVPLAGEACALTARAEGVTFETGDFAALRERLASAAGPDGWRLVVVDPLARFADAEAEVDNAAATRFVQALEGLTKVNGKGSDGAPRPGPAVLVAHHTSKASRRDGDASGNAVRGASALIDGARWCATLEAVNPTADEDPGFEGVRLALVKSNYSASAPALLLRRGPHGRLSQMTEGEREKFAPTIKRAGKAGAERKAGSANGNPATHYRDPDDRAGAANHGVEDLD